MISLSHLYNTHTAVPHPPAIKWMAAGGLGRAAAVGALDVGVGAGDA